MTYRHKPLSLLFITWFYGHNSKEESGIAGKMQSNCVGLRALSPSERNLLPIIHVNLSPRNRAGANKQATQATKMIKEKQLSQLQGCAQVQEEEGELLDLTSSHIAELKRETEFVFKDLNLLQPFCIVHCWRNSLLFGD